MEISQQVGDLKPEPTSRCKSAYIVVIVYKLKLNPNFYFGRYCMGSGKVDVAESFEASFFEGEREAALVDVVVTPEYL